MRRWLSVMSVAVSILALPAVARAQAKAGDKEIQIFGNVITIITPSTRIGNVTFGGTSATGNLFINAGVFVSDNTEVGGGPSITISSDDPIFDTGVSVFLRNFFGDQSAKIKPYVSVDYFIQSFNTSGNQSIADNQFLNVGGGIRDYLNEKTALDISVKYGFNPKNSDLKLIIANIGITFVF